VYVARSGGQVGQQEVERPPFGLVDHLFQGADGHGAVRGVEMFRNENVNIPVAGIIENMAWFTPEELPENRYYLFGKGGARR